MNALQTFRIALRALLRNKLRSFLTTLGIVIGVGAVIAMVAIGEGAKANVAQSFTAMGTNLLIVLPGTTTRTSGQAPYPVPDGGGPSWSPSWSPWRPPGPPPGPPVSVPVTVKSLPTCTIRC